MSKTGSFLNYYACVCLGVLLGAFFYCLVDFNPYVVESMPAEEEISVHAIPRRWPPSEPFEFKRKTFLGEYRIIPLSDYRISGIMAGIEFYPWGGAKSELALYDMVLVWGELADERYYGQLRVAQSGRQYFCRFDTDFEMAPLLVKQYSSLNHIIPANLNILGVIKRIRPGTPVMLEGYLVNVNGTFGKDSFEWISSLPNTDTEPGTGEILYVTRVVVDGREYR